MGFARADGYEENRNNSDVLPSPMPAMSVVLLDHASYLVDRIIDNRYTKSCIYDTVETIFPD